MSELENGWFIIGFDGTENLNETHCLDADKAHQIQTA